MCGCQSSFTGQSSNANGEEEKSGFSEWFSGLFGGEKTGNQEEAEKLKKEAEEKGLTPEEYAKQLEDSGDLEKSSKLKQWIDDGTLNGAVNVLGNIWGQFKNPTTNNTTITPIKEEENMGLYIGVGVFGLLLVLGGIYFVKNRK